MSKKASSKTAPNPVGLAPGIQLPQGVMIQHATPPFPPDLERQLQEARKSGGRYFVTIARADEQGNITLDSHRGQEFSPDWLLRAHRLVSDQILSGSLSSPPASTTSG